MQNNIFFKTKNLRMLIFLGYISFEFTFKAYLTVLVRTVYFNEPFPLLFGKTISMPRIHLHVHAIYNA